MRSLLNWFSSVFNLRRSTMSTNNNISLASADHSPSHCPASPAPVGKTNGRASFIPAVRNNAALAASFAISCASVQLLRHRFQQSLPANAAHKIALSTLDTDPLNPNSDCARLNASLIIHPLLK